MYGLPDVDPADTEVIIDENAHPFEQSEDGTFHVTQPIQGICPDRLTLTVDGDRYIFEDYQGRVSRSRIYPEVLAYGHCVKVTEADGP
jgi:hypothetical protein